MSDTEGRIIAAVVSCVNFTMSHIKNDDDVKRNLTSLILATTTALHSQNLNPL